MGKDSEVYRVTFKPLFLAVTTFEPGTKYKLIFKRVQAIHVTFIVHMFNVKLNFLIFSLNYFIADYFTSIPKILLLIQFIDNQA
jgi:hypothetical protein